MAETPPWSPWIQLDLKVVPMGFSYLCGSQFFCLNKQVWLGLLAFVTNATVPWTPCYLFLHVYPFKNLQVCEVSVHPFYRWGNWGLKASSYLFKVIQPGKDRAGLTCVELLMHIKNIPTSSAYRIGAGTGKEEREERERREGGSKWVRKTERQRKGSVLAFLNWGI